MKTYLCSFFLILLFTSCSNKSEQIISKANSIIGFKPTSEVINSDKIYKYTYPDNISFKSNQNFIDISNKIDVILGSIPTNNFTDVPVSEEFMQDNIKGLSDLKEWDTPDTRVVLEKFRAVKYDCFIRIIITEK